MLDIRADFRPDIQHEDIIRGMFSRRAPLNTILLMIFLDVFAYGMVAPLLPVFVQHFEGGAALAGFLGSSYALMQLVSGPVLGPLSDRFGRRPVLAGCLVGTVLAMGLLGLANSLALIFLAVAIDGLTGGNLTVAQACVADITSEEERARGLGLVGAAMGVGLMTGPALGGLISFYDIHLAALAASGMALLNVALGLWLLPETLSPERRTRSLHLPSLNLAAQLKQAFSHTALRPLLLTIFALNLGFAGLQSNFPLFSQARFGWNTLQNGILFAFVGVCAVLTQGVLVGRLSPVWGERRLTLFGLGLAGLMLAGIALNQQAWLLFPLLALLALGTGSAIPSLTSLISKAVSGSQQGQVMGGMQSLLSLASIIGPSLAGVTFERVGVSAPYWLGSLFALLALGLAGLAFRPSGRADPGAPA